MNAEEKNKLREQLEFYKSEVKRIQNLLDSEILNLSFIDLQGEDKLKMFCDQYFNWLNNTSKIELSTLPDKNYPNLKRWCETHLDVSWMRGSFSFETSTMFEEIKDAVLLYLNKLENFDEEDKEYYAYVTEKLNVMLENRLYLLMFYELFKFKIKSFKIDF